MELANVRFKIKGEGQTLVLVNMHFQRIETWEKITEDLTRYYRVIYFEFPNQGSSPENSHYTSLIHYAEFVRDLLAELNENPEEIIAYGYSFGANVIRIMSLKLNVRFKALIIGGISPLLLKDYYIELIKSWNDTLIGSGMDVFAKTLCLRIFSPEYISQNPSITDVLVKGMKRNYQDKADGLKAILNAPAVYYQSEEPAPEQYSCPVHVIGCENDMIIPCNFIQEYSKAIKAASFHLIPRCGHDPIFEKPSDLTKIIDDIAQGYEE
ncbi:MAG: alpha/beta fold hydrolase [Solirubrobacterales bacterium]